MNNHARDENLMCINCNRYFTNRNAFKTHTYYTDKWPCRPLGFGINDPEDGFDKGMLESVIAPGDDNKWSQLWKLLFPFDAKPLPSSRSS